MNEVKQAPLPVLPIAAVMVYVSDPEAGLNWYQKAFPGATRQIITEFAFEYLDYYGVMIEVVPADEKVTSGSAATVSVLKVNPRVWVL